ncbi:hypothetical protein NEISICOT_02703 [Neisseria sicca ATCC 29256]|uniref:Uncharacterized protein n=2 Tax=Neisseria TaxID=482 RepID=D2ZVA3_NEIM2|nr:hypothetical protein NM96_03695 [Neisseria mucosa]EET43482.1 hypothetical protein NEISICOT_02703 [Neisseria sicca ATCC 29256]EFC88884.1 hypothetical protein NEIMUCOT_04546 [Neisseria mucosa ATCC 25996]
MLRSKVKGRLKSFQTAFQTAFFIEVKQIGHYPCINCPTHSTKSSLKLHSPIFRLPCKIL